MSGGTSPDRFAVTSGSLPTGLTLNTSTGIITGTPSSTSGSPYAFTVGVTDTAGAVGTQSYSVVINPTLTITNTTLPSGMVAHAYTGAINISGGTSPDTFVIMSGTLPSGLSLNSSTGAITGTPTTGIGSPFTFTVGVTDLAGAAASQSYSVSISTVLTITTATLPNWTVNQAYTQTVSVIGGVSPYSFALTTGSLPTGLSLNSSTGVITGTPSTTSGSPFAFTISVTDSVNSVTNASYSVTINPTPTIATTTLPDWTVNAAYSQTITVAGGTNPDTFAVTSGSLPTGLTLNSNTGAITGTPNTTSGSPFAFTISATDAAGAVASRNYSEAINTAISITTTTLPSGTLNQSYSQTIGVSGGTNPDTFAITSGSLPTGLTLNSSTGALTGTPTTATGSPFTFTITATDAAGSAASKSYTLTIIAPLTITTTTLPNGTINQHYSQTISVSGGTNPDTFALTSGALPPGITLNSASGVISGTSTATVGSFNFTVTATDAVNDTTSQSYHIVINPALTISPTTLPAASIGVAYSETITVANGTSPFTSLTATAFNGGTTGLTASAITTNVSAGTVTINGTPSAMGSATFTVTAIDGAGATLTENYTLTMFGISSVTATPSGVVLLFNAPINPATTVLYSSPGDTTLGPPDVTVVGATTGAIRGSLVIDATNPDMATFIQTSGLLASDTYTITVTTGVKAVGGATLAANFTTTLNVVALNGSGVVCPQFRAGAGQTVDVPTSNTGIPISISNASNVTQASFALTYDPTLLTIAATGALTPLTGLTTVSYGITSVDSHHSILTVNLSGGTGLTVGSTAQMLVNIAATVPDHSAIFQ